jgi:hypothetical protein
MCKALKSLASERHVDNTDQVECKAKGQAEGHEHIKISFLKGDVVAVKKPTKVKFATVLVDTIYDSAVADTVIPVLYLEEIEAVDCSGSESLLKSRSVHFLTHVSKKVSHIRFHQLLLDDKGSRIIRWNDCDIWDHLVEGGFRNVSREAYLDRSSLPTGVKATVFLLEKSIFEAYRLQAGCDTREVKKRTFMWPQTSVDERRMKRLKV